MCQVGGGLEKWVSSQILSFHPRTFLTRSQQPSFPALHLRELPSGYLHPRASAQPAVLSANRGFSPAPDWRGLGANAVRWKQEPRLSPHHHSGLGPQVSSKRPPEIQESHVTALLPWLGFLLLP